MEADQHGHNSASDAVELADLLGQATRSLRRRWVDSMGPMHLSPHQGRALRVISAGGGQRLSEIAQVLRIAPRSATEVVDALEEHGLVERTPDPDDRRAVLVRQTPEGERVRAALEAARRTNAEEFFARLGDADRQELARLLRSLLAEA